MLGWRASHGSGGYRPPPPVAPVGRSFPRRPPGYVLSRALDVVASLALRYGVNPHQTPARVFADGGLPFEVLNGAPGYINLLDALNAWQLVKELRQVLQLPAAASFKHVSPAGAAVGLPLTDVLRRAYFVGDKVDLSPLACAYARARGADRVCSYGDWVALSDTVDVPTAQYLRREVSDGVIAPAYEPEALELLKSKKQGRYTVLQVEPTYEPPEIESRQVFGVTFEQRRNAVVPGLEHLENVVTKRASLSDEAQRDLLIGLITLKYTQSNSVCLVKDGQVIGNGAGQQSRIHCTRLAAGKADTWWLRQHPRALSLQFKPGIDRVDRDNAIDQFLRDDLTPAEEAIWRTSFDPVPERLSPEDKHQWLLQLRGVALASDAFIPFRDNVDRAHASGVEFVVQPGGAQRDADVIDACDGYGMAMAFSGLRLFHH
ncbi:MAG: phosphoribosylaminoimidazolecarboxamide formyltransferase [Chloroflexi bacterium]|nr:phosphoribosylaminoimidazolecarboxamide formyltransferase [Chloroflexota bacterium]